MLAKDAMWHGNAPAEPDSLNLLRVAAGVELPDDYLRFLAFSDGGEGPLGVDPGYIVIDPVNDVVAHKKNRTFEEFFPGFLVFGGNGGGELLAFDIRSSGPWPVVMIAMTNIDLSESVVRIAADFSELLKSIGNDTRT